METNQAFPTNTYISTGGATTTGFISIEGAANYIGNGVSYKIEKKSGISPHLYFKFIKKKFGTLEGMRLNGRLKRLEQAFNKAVENGQEYLGHKLMNDLARETRESALYACGIKHFIEFEDVQKHKHSIHGGHISDTKLEDYTRVIPDNVIEKKKKVERLFDGFVIYHVWDQEAERKREKKQKMSDKEKANMRDPVLFGVIRESSRLYFIADWEDEFCDLTFEEMIDVIGKDEEDITIPRNPKI